MLFFVFLMVRCIRGEKLKKAISTNELLIGGLILSAIPTLVFIFLGFSYIKSILPIIIFLLVIVILMEANKKIWSKELPLESHYNPFGYIEIHVGVECNNSSALFVIGTIETIIKGIDEKKDILFDTWIISENKAKKLFGDAVEVSSPGLLQKISNSLNKRKYDPKNRKKSYRYIVRVDKITDKQIKEMKDLDEKLKRRNEPKASK